MLKGLSIVLCTAFLVTSGCAKKVPEKQEEGKAASSRKAGAATAEEAARGFLAAAGKRDLPAAKRFLMDESVCKLAPPDRQKGCPEFIQEVYTKLPGYVEKIPKGFVPGEMKDAPEPRAPKEIKFYAVTPKGGGEPEHVMVTHLGDRFYIGFPIVSKARE